MRSHDLSGRTSKLETRSCRIDIPERSERSPLLDAQNHSSERFTRCLDLDESPLRHHDASFGPARLAFSAAIDRFCTRLRDTRALD